MPSLDITGPNAEQIQYWNELAGPKWVAFQQLIDEQIAPLGRRAMDRAAIAPGERVLDVGCGCGQTTLELARRVAPTGSATGVDISAVMLAHASEAARSAGLVQVHFENADAQTHRFDAGTFDVLFSRFGIMFFTDPQAAFANLWRALRPGGRVSFVCWQPLQENPWMLVPLMGVAQHIMLPAPPSPDAPGPFAFADAERVRGILTRAGFEAVSFEGVNEILTIGGGRDLDGAVDFMMQIGPAARALREVDPAVIPVVTAAVRQAITPFYGPHGVRMSSAAWIVSALKG